MSLKNHKQTHIQAPTICQTHRTRVSRKHTFQTKSYCPLCTRWMIRKTTDFLPTQKLKSTSYCRMLLLCNGRQPNHCIVAVLHSQSSANTYNTIRHTPTDSHKKHLGGYDRKLKFLYQQSLPKSNDFEYYPHPTRTYIFHPLHAENVW